MVVQEVRTKGGSSTAKVVRSTSYYRGSKVRTDMGKVSAIIDSATQTMTSLDHQRKTYTVLPLKSLAGDPKGVMSQYKASGSAKVSAGGSGPTVLGKPTQLYKGDLEIKLQGLRTGVLLANTHYKFNIWTTTAVPAAVQAAGQRASMLTGLAATLPQMKDATRELSKLKGFPLKMESTIVQTRNGKTVASMTTTMQAVSLKQVPVAANLFSPPKGYRRFDLQRKIVPKVKPVDH